MRNRLRIGLASTLAVAAASSLIVVRAQAPDTKADSAQVKAHVETARKTAGEDWAEAFAFFCGTGHANRADDPVIEPTQLFDNLYAIGRTTTITYALKTSAGIILIDSGYQNDVDNVLLAGFKKLNLDPATIKEVIVTHGHADHFGGAKTLQDRYGAHIWITAADWDFMARPPARGGGQPAAGREGGQPAPARGDQPVPARGGGQPPVVQPTRDRVIADGQAITLGDETVTPFFLPGHTPGTVALIFGVKDKGKAHVAGLLGAPMLIPPPDPAPQQHVASMEHFGEIAKKMKVDVELLNHPIMDGGPTKLARLQTRKAGGPNPFVVGVDGYQRFLTVSEECLKGVIQRRVEARAATN